jgi:glycosyltransferase involved in cell wall biosynthesis
MCAALAEAGALVKLVARQGEAMPSGELLSYYGLSPTFEFRPAAWPRWPRAADLFQARAVFAEPGPGWVCYTRGRDLTASMVALLRGLWAVVELHGLPATARERLMLGWMSRQPRARLITISEPLRDHYRHQFEIETGLAPDGVDLKRFDPPVSREAARAQLGLGPGPWVVYVGGLYAGRGVETLFAAAAGLPVQVLIVGGRDEADLAGWRAQAAAAGAARVRFEGYQAPARIPLYLFAADILAMPYGSRILTGSGEDITCWTSPLKLFEYLAAGRPIVASDVQAVRGVLVHDSNALLGAPEDVAGLRDSIRRLLADPALAGRLAAAARQTARGHTWAARAGSILEMISSGQQGLSDAGRL